MMCSLPESVSVGQVLTVQLMVPRQQGWTLGGGSECSWSGIPTAGGTAWISTCCQALHSPSLSQPNACVVMDISDSRVAAPCTVYPCRISKCSAAE